MSRKKYDHIHQYQNLLVNSATFRCTIEGCPHSISRAMLVGRSAHCPDCSTTFTIKYEHLTRKVVVCGCKLKEKQEAKSPAKRIDNSISDLLSQVQTLNRKESDDIQKTSGRTSVGDERVQD